MQITITIKYYFILNGIAKIRNIGEDLGTLELMLCW